MIIQILINITRTAATILMIAVIVDIVLSFFMSPYHPIRSALDKVVQPLLAPIRKVVPLLGGIDFSPLILIILIQLIESVVIRLLALLW
jgi:YggT family protein